MEIPPGKVEGNLDEPATKLRRVVPADSFCWVCFHLTGLFRRKAGRQVSGNISSVVCVIFLAISICFFLIFKDRLVTQWIFFQLRRVIPEATFAVRKLTVGPGSVTIRDFSIVQQARGDHPRLEIRGSGVVVRLSLFGFLQDPLLVVKEAVIHAELIQWGAWTVHGFNLHVRKHPHWPYLHIRAEMKDFSSQQKEVKDVCILMLANKEGILVNDLQAGAVGGCLRAFGFVTTPRRLYIRGRKTALFGSAIVHHPEQEARGRVRMNNGRSVFRSTKPLALACGASFTPEIASFVFYLKDIHLKDVMSFLGGSKGMDTAGVFTGRTVVSWQEGELRTLRGELNSVSGGWFMIKDPSLLEQGLGNKEKQNIVIENLKNYYYDIGKIELRNSGQDIRMDVVLQGKAGRRDLELIWHRERNGR